MAITDLPQYTYSDESANYYVGLLLNMFPDTAVVDVAGTPTVVTLTTPRIHTEDLRRGMVYCQKVSDGSQIITCFDYLQREFTAVGAIAGPNLAITDQQTQLDEISWWRHKDNPPVNETNEKSDTTTQLG